MDIFFLSSKYIYLPSVLEMVCLHVYLVEVQCFIQIYADLNKLATEYMKKPDRIDGLYEIHGAMIKIW